MSFSFGSFEYPCSKASLVVCTALQAVEPECYARNVEINGFLMFQPSTLVIHVIAMLMTLIMIFNIRSKYTAVGRKEIVMFFYLYLIDTILEFFLISNIIPAGTSAFNWFSAFHVASITTTFWILLLNGFVGFQWAEDGTPMSLWFFRGTGSAVFAVSFFISIATFNDIAGLSKNNAIALYIIYFIFNLVAFLIYSVLQIILVVNTLEDRWPLGDIIFGVLFFVLAQVFLFPVSNVICSAARHYIDGVFVATVCILLSVMMVYKYWDSITKEDLEFCVAGGPYPWDVNDTAARDENEKKGAKY